MQWLFLQLADSAFPAGGFTHSQGLEAAVQEGAVRDEQTLRGWLDECITQTAFGFLPFLADAHAGAFLQADAAIDVFLLNHVSHRASRQQGQALAATAEGAFGGALLTQLREQLRSGSTPGHLAPVLGVVTRVLGLDAAAARRLGAWWVLRGAISAAVRLNVIGPIAAQGMQRDLAPSLDRALAASDRLGARDATQTAPLLDLAQMRHDRLYSRLFQS